MLMQDYHHVSRKCHSERRRRQGKSRDNYKVGDSEVVGLLFVSIYAGLFHIPQVQAMPTGHESGQKSVQKLESVCLTRNGTRDY